MTLGKRIKEHRNRVGLSQEKIAEMVGISRQAVTKWESDLSVPCMENLIALANIFEIPLDELATGENPERPKHQKKIILTDILMDIVFVVIAVFAVLSILQIPAFIGMSIVGFFIILAQAAAVLYVPLYLLVLRPRRKKRAMESRADNAAGKAPIKERILWAFGAALSLAAGYVLCGHVFLFLHGMGQWPIALFLFGLAVIGISAISDSRKVMLGTVAGYIAGFVAGMLFNWDTYHPYRGSGVYSNNNWVIWTVAYLVFIFAGIVWEIVRRRIIATQPSLP